MEKTKTIKFPFSIRVKVILPYLVLTLAVAITGAYVVTKLVANSLSERLTNQLLEAGRVVSDSIVKQEISHLEIARIIAYTRGLGEALATGDSEKVEALAQPISVSMGVENLIIVDAKGLEVVHLLLQPDGNTLSLKLDSGAFSISIVNEILSSSDLNQPPKRALGVHPANLKYYYYTAAPIYDNDALTGVVVIGTSLETLLPDIKNTALADIILYQQEGQAIITSLSTLGEQQELLHELSLSQDTYTEIINNPNTVNGSNISVYGRQYRLAWGPLKIGNERIGVFAVALPLNFVLQAGTTSRNTYAFLFTIAMVGVIMTGFSIARIITRPLNSLVQTSQAIASGKLDQRTGIRSEDEIGLLAETFDVMTDRLASRTKELESAYQALSQMDKTKVSFINVSAHELRTPLTLIKGYAQMLSQKSQSDPSLDSLSQGILNGTNRMLDIVNNMLDVTRIDSQMLKVVPELVEVDALAQRVQEEFQLALKERNLTLRCNYLQSLPLIMADPDLLYKVFYHLVMNAIKYTPDGGVISVYGEVVNRGPDCPEVEIIFQDTGIGINPADLELIFEKFYQTGEVQFHSSSKTKFKGGGPGLGLAIAKGIIEAHGGKIWAESDGHDEKKHAGSRFHVRLPVKVDSA